MKLAHNFRFWNLLRRLLSGHRPAARRSYTITVPAPHSEPAGNVVVLRPNARVDERNSSTRRHSLAAGARVASR
jgi:hypothetical protein